MTSIEELEQHLSSLIKEIKELKQEKPVKTGKKEKKTDKKQEDITPERHTPEDISMLLKGMDKEELKSRFGLDIGRNKDNPYHVIGVTQFHKDFNIQSDSKYYKPRLSYAHKHQIIGQLLQGENRTKQEKTRELCLSYLKNQLENPPQLIRGKKPSEKQLNAIATAVKTEIQRWN